MKKVILILASLLIWASGYTQELEKFCEDLKWGFRDPAGNVVVPAKYDKVGNDLFEILSNKGYDNLTENEVLYLKDGFSEGLAKVCLNNKWGYIDTLGNEVIPPKYDFAESFSEGFAMVCLNNKWGYIDMLGNEVISPKYDVIVTNFSEGLRAVGLNGKWGYIDTLGSEVISPKYDFAGNFSEGFAMVLFNEKWGYIDKTGEEVSINRPLPLATPAKIKVIRRKSMLGAVVSYNVHLNNKYVGYVKNGGTLEIPIHTSHNVVTVSDGIGPFDGNSTVVLEEGGYAEVYVKARRFVKQ